MAVSRDFLELILDQMARFGPATARRMFGGVGIFRDEIMFALIVEDTLYLKAAPADSGDFEIEGLEPFTYRTSSGRTTVMSYRRAPERCLEDQDAMTEWCRKAWTAASNGPKMGRGGKKV